MKNLIVTFSVLFFLSCAGMKISDTAHYKTLAYASGKAMGITINKRVPEADSRLTSAWVDLMERNATMEEISSAQMIEFYNECLMIIASPIKNPYDIIGDLSTLLIIYSAEFDSYNGEMISIQPVPLDVMRFFEMGYASGRKVARIDR